MKFRAIGFGQGMQMHTVCEGVPCLPGTCSGVAPGHSLAGVAAGARPTDVLAAAELGPRECAAGVVAVGRWSLAMSSDVLLATRGWEPCVQILGAAAGRTT